MGRAHVLLGAESRATAVDQTTAGASGSVCQPAAHSRSARAPVVTATRREVGALESAPLRPRRDAKAAFARTAKYPQAAGGPLGRGQSGVADAQALWSRHAARPSRSICSRFFGCGSFRTPLPYAS